MEAVQELACATASPSRYRNSFNDALFPLDRDAMGWLWCLLQRLAPQESTTAVAGANPSRSGEHEIQGDGLREAVIAAMPSMDPPLAQLPAPIPHPTFERRTSHARPKLPPAQGCFALDDFAWLPANVVQIRFIKWSQARDGDRLCLGVKSLDILSVHPVRKEESRSE